jgi:hypothetical protein
MIERADKQVVWETLVTAVDGGQFAPTERDLLWNTLIELRQKLMEGRWPLEMVGEDEMPMVWPIGPTGRCEACEL